MNSSIFIHDLDFSSRRWKKKKSQNRSSPDWLIWRSPKRAKFTSRLGIVLIFSEVKPNHVTHTPRIQL
jgi:hypothetical protein